MSAERDRLHAYVDDALPPSERAAVEAWLAEHPEEALMVRSYADQRGRLRQHFDYVLSEPVPARMYLRRPKWIDFARAALVFAVGIGVGLALPLLRHEPPAPAAVAQSGLAWRAARAHATYVAEVRHAVEVDATQQEHLVRWLSRRLGTDLKVPVLTGEGFELLGGRLLPGPEGPVAHFMFQDGSGKRLTLYVNARSKSEGPTAFRYAREGNVSVFYWIDGQWGYALSGDIDKAALSRVANTVYRQLNP